MIKVPKERRVDKRRLAMSVPCMVSGDKKTYEEGTTFDISKGGMCLFAEKDLEVGRVIEVRCDAIWDGPKTGTVRWCQKIRYNLYRIGISFT